MRFVTFAIVLLFLSPVIKFYFGFIAFFDYVLPFFILSAFIFKLKLNRLSKLDYYVIFCILSLVIYALLSAIYLGDMYSVIKALKIFLGFLVFLTILLTVNVQRTLNFLIISLIILATILAFKTFLSDLKLIVDNRLVFTFCFGTGILACHYVLKYTRASIWVKGIVILAGATLFIALFFTANRGGALSVMAVILFDLLYKKVTLRSLSLLVLTTCTIGFGYYFFIYDPDDIMLVRLIKLFEEGDQARVIIYSDAIDAINRSFPYGVGLGNSYKYLKFAEFPHNIILELVLELGIVSIIFISSLFVTLVAGTKAKSKYTNIFFLIYLFILFNFLKSYSLNDLRFILIPLAFMLCSLKQSGDSFHNEKS